MGQIWFLAEIPSNSKLRDLDSVRGNIMGWRTARIRRVCRSTFAAETLSAVDCVDRSIFMADLLSFILFQTSKKVGTRTVSDCCSLVQHVQFSSIISQSKILEKRLTLDLHYIKNEVKTAEYVKELVWTQTSARENCGLFDLPQVPKEAQSACSEWMQTVFSQMVRSRG